MNLARATKLMENPLDRALVTYFEERKGKWIRRQAAMRACGFESPDVEPFLAYVSFANSVLRCNRILESRGIKIKMSEDGDPDFFSLDTIEEAH